MNKLKDIFTILKNYFSKLLKKEQTLLITDGLEKEDRFTQEEYTEESQNEELKVENDFFEVYQNIKDGTISVKDLMIDDVIKVQMMLQNEADIYCQKINEKQIELFKLKEQRKQLDKEKLELEKSN